MKSARKPTGVEYVSQRQQQSVLQEAKSRKLLVQQVMANAPQEAKDRALKRQDKKSKCNDALTSASKPAPITSANAMTKSSDGITIRLNSVFFMSFLTALLHSAVQLWQ
jgi:hypothetical protein